MSRTKDLFYLMRQEEIVTDNFLPTKKELQKSSKEFAKNIIDNGEHNIKEVYAQALRLKESLTAIESELKTYLGEENFEAFGIKATFRSGGDTINYSEDEIFATIKSDLDARTEQLKMAQKQDTFDAYGNQVPKVSTTPRKSSLAISF